MTHASRFAQRLAVTIASFSLVTPLMVAAAFSADAHPRTAPSWHLLDTGTSAHFRGLSPVSAQVAWLGGYDGLVLRTVDGGRHWQDVSPPGAGALQFRDIEAFDAQHAVAMSAGSGADSRLYRTSDGGTTWTLTYQNMDAAAFFDCMSFADRRHGLVMSDPVDGKFRILATSDGGKSWTVTPTSGMPAALPGEAGFAASGECLTTRGDGAHFDAWFGSGGGAQARVFHSSDGGRHWTVTATGMGSGGSAGIFAVAFRDERHGIAIGGDFSTPNSTVDALALTRDGGRTFTVASGQVPAGYRSGLTWLPRSERTAIAVGPSGSDISYDGGRTWKAFDTGSFDTVSCARDGSCWASGEAGRVAVLHLSDRGHHDA